MIRTIIEQLESVLIATGLPVVHGTLEEYINTSNAESNFVSIAPDDSSYRINDYTLYQQERRFTIGLSFYGQDEIINAYDMLETVISKLSTVSVQSIRPVIISDEKLPDESGMKTQFQITIAFTYTSELS
jgi:hypothetical protein